MQIVIAEDSALFREGMARLLQDAGHEVIARVGDAQALLATVRVRQPDLVVADIRMPPDMTDDGARAAHQLRQEFPGLGILLLSQHVETASAIDLVGNGAFGYLLKDRVLDVEDFLEAALRVADGGSAIDPEVVAGLLALNQTRTPLERLTSRERDVLSLMAQGYTNIGIARRLWLTERTVETHITNLLAKLGLGTSKETHRRVLAVLAYLSAQP